ncbi:MAG: hypothetical protein FWD92_06195 [Methanomassiliicoccaceae archaeon]|nr:hypothetical protein [Methanomassiliicoccaceae archaeon]
MDSHTGDVSLMSSQDHPTMSRDSFSYNMLIGERTMISDGLVRIEIFTNNPRVLEATLIRTTPAMGAWNVVGEMENLGGGHFVFVLSYLDRQFIMGGGSHIGVMFTTLASGTSYHSTFIHEVSLYSSEFPINVLDMLALLLSFGIGVILVVCAIFSTPWMTQEKVRNKLKELKK